jgi:hypothetical protein
LRSDKIKKNLPALRKAEEGIVMMNIKKTGFMADCEYIQPLHFHIMKILTNPSEVICVRTVTHNNNKKQTPWP